jgi:hypothetical protein
MNQDRVIVTQSATGWMRIETMDHYIDEVLIPFVQDVDVDHYVMILDQFSVHRNEDILTRITGTGALVEFVPAKCTSLAQPLDLTVMVSFKRKVRRH